MNATDKESKVLISLKVMTKKEGMPRQVWNFSQTLRQDIFLALGVLRCVPSLLQRSCSTDVSITYLPQVNATHCSKVKINLTLLQYRIAVVGAETAFRALQPQRSQLQYTMNAA